MSVCVHERRAGRPPDRRVREIDDGCRVLLVRLRQGPSTVSGLTGAVGMTQPAVSHQLRILRDLGMVVGRRDGRQIVYSLHDAHVAGLLDEAVRHVDRLDKAEGESR